MPKKTGKQKSMPPAGVFPPRPQDKHLARHEAPGDLLKTGRKVPPLKWMKKTTANKMQRINKYVYCIHTVNNRNPAMVPVEVRYTVIQTGLFWSLDEYVKKALEQIMIHTTCQEYIIIYCLCACLFHMHDACLNCWATYFINKKNQKHLSLYIYVHTVHYKQKPCLCVGWSKCVLIRWPHHTTPSRTTPAFPNNVEQDSIFNTTGSRVYASLCSIHNSHNNPTTIYI